MSEAPWRVITPCVLIDKAHFISYILITMNRGKGGKHTKLILLFSIIILLNIVILFYFLNFYIKQKSKIEDNYLYSSSKSKISEKDFYNTPCPEVDILSMKGVRYSLKKYVGEVILLRFSRFNAEDLPRLVFLDHLHGQLKKYGLNVFFINLLRNTDRNISVQFPDLITPIIDDDGYISGIFRARLNDTIIIGKDFKIKFQFNAADNVTLYRQTLKLLSINAAQNTEGTNNLIDRRYLSLLLQKIVFRNSADGNIEYLRNIIKNKNVIITIFIAPCLSCPEMKRIGLINKISENPLKNKPLAIILFGVGNNLNSINQIFRKYEVGDNIKIGIIETLEDQSNEDYYKLFKLDLDPRIIILNNNSDIIFLEDFSNRQNIGSDYLIRLIQ